jgi:Ni/Fe-hydrogenase 1 B-type cytochrome subunit
MTTTTYQVTPSTPIKDVTLAQVYVWELPVRVTHWLIALSMIVLAATGIYIGRPFLAVTGEATDHFVTGTIRTVHSYAAIVFTVSVLSRITWMFVGNKYAHWDKFLPVRPIRAKGLWPTFKFYTFLMRKPPGFVGHNPLAGAAYAAVFCLYFVMITTGFAMFSAGAGAGSVMHAFQFLIPLIGGLETARWIHHVTMWLLLGFVVHHVYSAVLMSHVEVNGTVESIFTGWKFVPREDLVHSGYRFIDRDTDKGG